MNCYFDPLNRACKNVIGAVANGQELSFTVFSLSENCEKGDFGGVFFTPTSENCILPTNDLYFEFGKDGEETTGGISEFVVLKENGKVIGFTTFIIAYNPQDKPKKIKF